MGLEDLERVQSQPENNNASHCNNIKFTSYAQAQSGPSLFALVESIRRG
jgi:hypothetical protein